MPKRNTPLTTKEKKFADGIVKGKGQRQAYVEAYNVKTKNLNTIDPNASRIARKKQVSEYLKKHVTDAKTLLYELMQDDSVKPETRAQIANSLIDRVEGKPVQRQINANTDTDKEYRWAE